MNVIIFNLDRIAVSVKGLSSLITNRVNGVSMVKTPEVFLLIDFVFILERCQISVVISDYVEFLVLQHRLLLLLLNLKINLSVVELFHILLLLSHLLELLDVLSLLFLTVVQDHQVPHGELRRTGVSVSADWLPIISVPFYALR